MPCASLSLSSWRLADLSKADREFIIHHPLPRLSQLQERLQRVGSSVESDRDTPDPNPPRAIIDLIQTLKAHDVASRLHLAASSLPRASGLAKLITHLEQPTAGTFDYDPYRQLSEHIFSKSPDYIIWGSVLALIAKTSTMPTTPPITPHRSVSGVHQPSEQTPQKYSTTGLENTSEFKVNIDKVLEGELKPSLRLDIPDFVSAVFDHGPHLKALAGTAFNRCQKAEDTRYTEGVGWRDWPAKCEQSDVIDWLRKTMSHLTSLIQNEAGYVAQRRGVYSRPNKSVAGNHIKRKIDTGIERLVEGADGSSQDDPPHWDRVLVVGELKSKADEDNHQSTFLQLAQYVREVFRTQDRRFVLGFTLCGPRLRLWQFDRSGSSASTSFDINEAGDRFVHVMLGYYLMSEEQLGFDPTIHRADGRHWIEIRRNNSTERLFVESEITKHAAIIGRATRCWRAYVGEGDARRRFVVKDSWQYKEREEEGDLIKYATSKEVTHIGQYYHHETVQCSGKDDDILGNVRRGMMSQCGRQRFIEKPVTQSSTSEFGDKTTSTNSKSGSKLRKRVNSSSPTPSRSSKRSRTSPSEPPTEATQNRIHRRVVTSTPGKPLNEASSRLAIVAAFSGAITGQYFCYQRREYPINFIGHQSLIGAGILHRDISIGNILLTETEDDGFLIDLDLAIKVKDHEPSGAPSRTGTRVFMSIRALLGDHHIFMHDLESFFWVFFWICVHYEGPEKDGKMRQQRDTIYEEWNYESPDKLATLKSGTISSQIFESVDKHVTKYCTPLLPCLKELHGVVFPGGVPRRQEDKRLYEEMIQIFERAKKTLEDCPTA